MEIFKKYITVDKKVGKELSQILIEGDIIVSDFKPDIEKILEANATAYIDNKDILNDKIAIKGNFNINILFIARGDDKSVYSMQSTYPINDFINIENLDKNMTIFTTCTISNLEYKLINDRKVSFRAVLDISVEIIGKEDFEVVYDVCDLNECYMKKTNISVNKLICSKFDRFNVKDEITISGGQPNIKEILNTNLNISNKDIKISNNKVVISGEIKASVLYNGEDDNGITTYFEQEIPFSGSIEVDGANEDMLADVYLDIQENNVKLFEDGDGEDRVISIDTYVGCNIKVTSEDDIEILEDIYSLKTCLNLDKSIKTYPAIVCKNKNQAVVKEVVTLDDELPRILQVLKISGLPILDNTQIMTDTVLVDGLVECQILYITDSDDYPLSSFNVVVPYSQVVDTKGAIPDVTLADIKASLENITVNMLSERELEIRCTLNFDTSVTTDKELSFITDVVVEDKDSNFMENIASMTIYIVEKGDTLWNLAKKFNTTIDDIVAINDLENPDLVGIGQKLLILKKIC